jgi:hypothetical protein
MFVIGPATNYMPLKCRHTIKVSNQTKSMPAYLKHYQYLNLFHCDGFPFNLTLWYMYVVAMANAQVLLQPIIF